MKRLVCLVLALVMIPCAATLADLDEWTNAFGLGFTIRYPDYMTVYSSWEDPRWRMDIFAEPDEEDEAGNPQVYLYVLRTGEDIWRGWLDHSVLPNINGSFEQLQRLPVDEPPVLDEPEELEMNLTMDMSYAFFQSIDGKWQQELFVFDHPTEDDYVVVCRFHANDDGWDSNVLHWMIATMEFQDYDVEAYGPVPSDDLCSFSLRPDHPDGYPFETVYADDDAPAVWLFTDSPVTGLKLEEVQWDDELYNVTGSKTLYTKDTFIPNEALAIHTYRSDPVPVLRLRCVNAEGVEEIWYFCDREAGSSLTLVRGTETGY